MNNKRLGTQFEREMCQLLAAEGWWTHFITPAADGGQPFDIIAIKAGHPVAIDCKTCVNHIFPLSRLEDNQVMAFEKWMACGNGIPQIAVKYDGRIYMIEYERLKRYGRIDLDREEPYKA